MATDKIGNLIIGYKKPGGEGIYMTIETRDFGKMELNEDELVVFRSPIYGFEALERYALLSDDETAEGLMWLQSVDEPETCFILLDPVEVGIDNYSPELPEDIAAMLELESMPAVRLIAVVPADFRDTTVNLKSPIIINPKNKLAAQVILDADYPIRMRLFESKEEA